MTVDISDQPSSIWRRFYRAYLARYKGFRALKHSVLMVWWPMRNLTTAIKTLRSPRIFYRVYLAKYAIFRLLKHVALVVWWTLRNVVAAIKALGRPRIFYRTYLARYSFFRWVKNLLLAIYFKHPKTIIRQYSIIRNIFLRKESMLQLIPARVFMEEQGIAPIQIEASSKMVIPGPRFVGNYPIDLHGAETVALDMPAIEVAEISDATVLGGTNLILSDSYAIHPDLLVPSRDVIPAETFGIASIDISKRQIKLRLPRKTRKSGRAISLLGQCTGNYAHWLTETLPKLLIVDSIDAFNGLPLLVDEWIHPNLHSSIELLNASRRAIIPIGRWDTLKLAGVIEISPPAYIPPEHRCRVEGHGYPEPTPEIFPFSKTAMEYLRNSANVIASVVNKRGPRKLYLRRSPESVGNGRFIVNIDEVEKHILAHGFDVIDPGKLSVAEQMSVFRNAECIISPVGAALANAIFAPKGCTIVALAPYYKNANYYYFSNMMGVLGHDLHYVLGPQMNMDGHAFHLNFSVDLDALDVALKTLARY